MPDTVSRSRGLHGNSEMTIIGYLIGAILLVVVLPLLPIFLLLLLVDRLLELTDRGQEPAATSYR